MMKILLIFLGGGTGSCLRYLLTFLFHTPFATLVANILGCLIIGALSSLISNAEWKLLLVTGFCGGFTTFSTFSNETTAMLRSGDTMQAVCYIAASVVLGILAVFAGAWLASKI